MFLKKNVIIFFFTLFTLIITIIIYSKYFKNNEIKPEKQLSTDTIYNSNIIDDINYNTRDVDGNEYTINALKGEIDFSDPSILFLTNVNALIKLKNSEIITVTSDFGKYNSENFDTIFSKNVIINYLDNKITGEYLDFSLERNSMIISRDVIYNNLSNALRADVIELNIKTKDTKIFMYEEEEKVNIKSKN